MLFHLLVHVVRLLSKGSTGDPHAHDQAMARSAARRRIAHADVPPIETLEAKYSERLDELTAMLLANDPARMHTRRSRNGNDPEHIRAMRQRYRLVAWTLLYRLLPEEAAERIGDILHKELVLWCGEKVPRPDAADPAGLVAQLRYWRSRWDYR